MRSLRRPLLDRRGRIGIRDDGVVDVAKNVSLELKTRSVRPQDQAGGDAVAFHSVALGAAEIEVVPSEREVRELALGKEVIDFLGERFRVAIAAMVLGRIGQRARENRFAGLIWPPKSLSTSSAADPLMRPRDLTLDEAARCLPTFHTLHYAIRLRTSSITLATARSRLSSRTASSRALASRASMVARPRSTLSRNSLKVSISPPDADGVLDSGHAENLVEHGVDGACRLRSENLRPASMFAELHNARISS
jgi:hypothetical protein